MNVQRRGFGLRDLIAVGVIAAVLAVAIPTLAHPHRLNRRQMCASNLKAIGTSAKIYANDNNEVWMIPPFRRQAIGNEGIDYLAGNHISPHPTNPGEVGYDRENESTSESPSQEGGSIAVSVTRAFWLVIRSDNVQSDQFICPSSNDAADSTQIPEAYYDFEGYRNISYGYLVPFGPRDTQPREGVDPRKPLAADKGPYYLNKFEPTFSAEGQNPVEYDDPLGRWRRYNSPNHHGQGQNVLLADGQVAFEYTPAAGVHGDNIYTLMTSGWDEMGFNLIHGESPHFATVAEFPYPGQDVFGADLFSSTDSLIYP